MFEPPAPPPASIGWFGWGAKQPLASPEVESKVDAAGQELGDSRAGDEVVNPLPVTGTGLVATIRNVFIPTPNPALAPAHPADPVEQPSLGSALSSTSSLPNGEKIHRGAHQHPGRKDKHEDYINTLEISSPENASTREAVVVLHGYAAALGYVAPSSSPLHGMC